MTGFAIPGVELRVLGPDGKRGAHDGTAMGEIVARGDVVMEGYWRQPEATAAAMKDGWFHTGDVATVDPDNYIQIVDRKKEIIVSGGENISSLEVEKVLLAHPAVYEAAVIPVPDEKWGEVPKALVVLKHGSTGHRRRTAGVLPRPVVALQVSALGRISRKPAQDRNRQAFETRAAAEILDEHRKALFLNAQSPATRIHSTIFNTR